MPPFSLSKPSTVTHDLSVYNPLFDCTAALSLDSRERGTTDQFHTPIAYQGKPKLLFFAV